MWLSHPKLSEIDTWFETKTKEFVGKENRNPNCDSEAWLYTYIYTDVHEVLFATFPSKLHSWLARLPDCRGHIQSDRPAQWNQATVQRLKNIETLFQEQLIFGLPACY